MELKLSQSFDNNFWLLRQSVVPSGTESGAEVAGAGRRRGHVQRVRGAGALQAR